MKFKVWILTLLVSPVTDIIWRQIENAADTYYVPLILKLILLGLVTGYERIIKKNDALSKYLMILAIILILSSGAQFITKSLDVGFYLVFCPMRFPAN